MSAPFTVQTIQGVPYWVDTTNTLYLYGSTPPLKIGTVDAATKAPAFAPTWKEDVKDFLLAYRQRLGEQTESALAER